MISVIIPTYNEESVILDCLRSLDNQSIKGFEVIVVDDGSTDKTMHVLSDFRFKNKDLKIFKQEHRGPGEGRNLGAKHAKGDILVFVDSDMTFDKHFLKMLINPILQGTTKGTFSKDEIVSNWSNVWSRCYNKNEGWVDKRRHPRNYPDTQKVFRAVLKSEFEKVGGFTAGGYNDDWSLSEKLGYEAFSSPNALFYHKNPESLSEIYNHAKWVGKRSYKLGAFGYLVALVRSSLPVSILIGIFNSFRFGIWQFFIFKIVYDFGVFMGILNFIFTKKGSK